jgi:nucleotide-binding universal stress UspA family protein
VLHVVEPVPPAFATAGVSYGQAAFGLGGPPLPVMDPDTWFRTARETFDHGVWPEVDYGPATPLVLRGDAEIEIRRQVSQWQPDLLVVGTHGKGVVDRLLMGSVTHHLLNDLPASLLVVPLPAEAGAAAAQEAA